MFKVALTGLIGAGKSTAALVFTTLGIPCYDTDANAKRLMGDFLRPKIEQLLGEQAFLENGSMDRKFIAASIFSDSEKRRQLNEIVHPTVKEDFLRWAESQTSPYVIAETALLFESGFQHIVDNIIVVTADTEERIARAMSRDKTDRESVERRIRAQESSERLLEIADYTIDNDECSIVITQVLQIHKNIVNFAGQKH